MLDGLSRGAIALLLLASSPPAAEAQDDDSPKAALMRSATDEEGLRGALDRIARSALDELEVVEVTGTLALDLEQAQLALGCMSVNAECLGTVAEENEVQLLLAPQLDDAGDQRILTIVLYDGRDGSVSQGTRRIDSGEGNDAVLDAVPGLLRELFGLPPLADDDPALGEEAGDGEDTDEGDGEGPGGGGEPPPRDDGIGLGGPVLLGVGGATLIGGVVAGVLFKSADDDWTTAAGTVGDSATAMDAADLRSKAEARGRAATALLIGGAVLAAGGLAWLLVDLMGGDDDGDGEVSVTPRFGVGGGEIAAGLALEMDL